MNTPSVFTKNRSPAGGGLVGQQPLSGRALAGRDRVPLGTLVGIAIVGSVVIYALGSSFTGLTIAVGVGYAVVTVGMVLQLGYSHQLAFSQAMFMSIGGYGVALLETKYGLHSAESMAVVIVGTLIVSALMGSVASGVPGLALPLATLILPLALYLLATYSNFLGSFEGINGVLPLWNGPSYAAATVRSGIVSVLFLAVASALVLRFMRSGVGLQLMALATDESLAESLGVNLRQRRLEVFVVGSVLAAVGGAIVVSAQGIVSPDLLEESSQITLLVMLYVAGSKNVIAAIFGAIIIEYLTTSTSAISSNLTTIEGAVLILVFLVEPNGVVGLTRRLWDALRSSRRPSVETVHTSVGAVGGARK